MCESWVISVRWTVEGKSARSWKARRAVPQGQATPGSDGRSTSSYTGGSIIEGGLWGRSDGLAVGAAPILYRSSPACQIRRLAGGVPAPKTSRERENPWILPDR